MAMQALLPMALFGSALDMHQTFILAPSCPLDCLESFWELVWAHQSGTAQLLCQQPWRGLPEGALPLRNKGSTHRHPHPA